MEKAKPKDQNWRQYQNRARYLSDALQTANTRIDRIKAIHFEQSGICKQCQEIYPRTTRKLCGDE